MTLIRMTLNQMTYSRITLNRMTYSRMTFSRMTLSRMTLNRMKLCRMKLSKITLSMITLNDTKLRIRIMILDAEYCYAEHLLCWVSQLSPFCWMFGVSLRWPLSYLHNSWLCLSFEENFKKFQFVFAGPFHHFLFPFFTSWVFMLLIALNSPVSRL